MVSRLFGKLEVQRHLMLGSAGACATAWVAAAAEMTPAPAMKSRRFNAMVFSLVGFVRQELPVQRDEDPVAFRVGLAHDVHLEIDRAHDPVAELLVDQLLD